LRFRVAAADLGFEGAAGGVEQLGQGALAVTNPITTSSALIERGQPMVDPFPQRSTPTRSELSVLIVFGGGGKSNP